MFASTARSQSAASLLVWLGVLAVLAILLAFILPYLIRDLDYRVARNESDTLKTLGNALLAAVQRNGYIPSHTNWAETVAAEAGWEVGAAAANPRHQPRVLLIDGGGWFTNVSLPYTQNSAGTTNFPANARMMIVSSLGRPLPLGSGMLSAANFSNLWMAAEGAASLPTSGPWAGWNGRSDDVKIERVNLSAVFVTLYLATYRNELTQGRYSIGSDATAYVAPYESDRYPTSPHYYLSGTTLYLRAGASPYTLDSTQLLIRDSSFLYQDGMWKSSAAGGNMPGGIDIAGVVSAFLNSVPNARARYGPDQQRRIVVAMMSYMSNYITWAQGGFVDNNVRSYLVNTVQPDLVATCQEIYRDSWGYYPTNASGPQ